MTGTLSGQDVYYMSNASISDCNGQFYDSNNGLILGNYDHNENYTFTICVPDSAEIIMEFTSFCTEDGYDFLTIYDGADTLSTQMGPAYTGQLNPGIIQSSGECLTFHFISDANVSCAGWQASWHSTVTREPEPGPIQIENPNPDCGTKTVRLQLSEQLPCDSLSKDHFSIKGPYNNLINATIPVNCTNDSASAVDIVLSVGLFSSGLYTVDFQRYSVDVCDSLWVLTSSDSLWVDNCPIKMIFSQDQDSICEGECVRISAIASQGDMNTYHYQWTPSAPDTNTLFVCPTQTTTYYLTVSDENQSPAVTDSVTIYVNSIPLLTSDSIVCESDSSFFLQASPSGGWWQGNGIIQSAPGIFSPDDAGAGTTYPYLYRSIRMYK